MIDDLGGVEAYVASLNERAEVAVEKQKPIKLYIRSADLVFRQACIYKNEGDDEKAYVLFLKYSNLVLREIPRHPEYRANTELIAPLRANCLTSLDVLEKLKPTLLAAYRDLQEQRRRNAQRLREAAELAARQAFERAEETAKTEAARAARIHEIRLMEATKAYNEVSKPSAPDPTTSSTLDPATATISNTATTTPPTSTSATSPSLAASTKPPAFFSESGVPLRPLYIPSGITDRFLALAHNNTRSGIETCGVLAGSLSHDAFTLTTLIIPKQTGTTDTCAMVSEEEILAVQDARDLLTLGWIHTHPTQQCFLSSVDLHTHFPYQLMMAEAVAIVVAPTQSPNYGVFRLTDPPGLDIIAGCPHRGFHPHRAADAQIYTALSGPTSHAQFRAGLALEVIDLR